MTATLAQVLGVAHLMWPFLAFLVVSALAVRAANAAVTVSCRDMTREAARRLAAAKEAQDRASQYASPSFETENRGQRLGLAVTVCQHCLLTHEAHLEERGMGYDRCYGFLAADAPPKWERHLDRWFCPDCIERVRGLLELAP